METSLRRKKKKGPKNKNQWIKRQHESGRCKDISDKEKDNSDKEKDNSDKDKDKDNSDKGNDNFDRNIDIESPKPTDKDKDNLENHISILDILHSLR